MYAIRGIVMIPVLLMLILGAGCAEKVRTGLDRIDEYRNLFEGRHVGIIANHTALNREHVPIAEVFSALPDVSVDALFGPEHGFRGTAEAGESIGSVRGEKDIPIYSLYGETRKPTPEMLEGLDLLIFDIQDIGARFYTYIYTMALAMEAAAEQGIRFVVLDRPNPINGESVEGSTLEPGYETFVGLFPVPVRHGLTAGEMALLINGEGWLKNGIRSDLEVIPVTGWKRDMWYDETGLSFIKPSPNIPDLETATVYPGICLLEGTSVSEGRGTLHPFLQFGAPWMDRDKVTSHLNELNLPGVRFEPVTFTPEPIEGMSSSPKHEGQECQGSRLIVTDRNILKPFRMGIAVVQSVKVLYPERLEWRESHFDRLCGTSKIRHAIDAGKGLDSLAGTWTEFENSFLEKRKKYLLYP